MDAIDSALGTPQSYAVVAPARTIVRQAGFTTDLDPEPPWADALRQLSGMERKRVS
jgi:hypothetical protein